MSIGRFLWGFVVIFIGLVFLLINFGILDSSIWSEIWRLWPLVLIIAGISIVSRSLSASLQIILNILIILIVIGSGVWIISNQNTTGSAPINSNISTQVIEEETSDSIKESAISINTGAAELNIDKSTDKLISGTIEGNFPVEVTRTSSGDKENLTLSSNIRTNLFFSNLKNTWDLNLNNSLPTSLDLSTGALKGSLDLSEVNLKSLNIKSGASSFDITLGDKADKLTGEVSIGASSVKIRVPKSVGLKLTADTGISSNNFASQELTKSGNVYSSSDFDKATKKAELCFKAGASSIVLERF